MKYVCHDLPPAASRSLALTLVAEQLSRGLTSRSPIGAGTPYGGWGEGPVRSATAPKEPDAIGRGHGVGYNYSMSTLVWILVIVLIVVVVLVLLRGRL